MIGLISQRAALIQHMHNTRPGRFRPGQRNESIAFSRKQVVLTDAVPGIDIPAGNHPRKFGADDDVVGCQLSFFVTLFEG